MAPGRVRVTLLLMLARTCAASEHSVCTTYPLYLAQVYTDVPGLRDSGSVAISVELYCTVARKPIEEWAA